MTQQGTLYERYCVNKSDLVCVLMGSELAGTDQKNELEVMVDSSVKILTQCAADVKKKNHFIGLIKKRD